MTTQIASRETANIAGRHGARIWCSAIAITTTSLLIPQRANADRSIQMSGARLFVSDSRTVGFRVLTGNSEATRAIGRLFAYNAKGEAQRIWESRLVNVPTQSYVVDDRRNVVTIDTLCRAGFEHAVAVYGPGGRVLADYRLDELLDSNEIRQHVPHSVSSRHWTGDAKFAFHEWSHLVITLCMGRAITMDLATGAIVADRK